MIIFSPTLLTSSFEGIAPNSTSTPLVHNFGDLPP
jgi:hypothetical protein